MTAVHLFLDNDQVTWEAIMAPHWERTELRMSAHPVVLCLHDNTELDFNGQKVRGLGPLNYDARRGMYLHPTYAVTPQREPLGVCDAWMWAREARDADGVRCGQKVSARWSEGYERVAKMAARVPSSRLVYVADREGDMLGRMQRAKALGTPADWLVRAKHNRCLPDGRQAVRAHLRWRAVGPDRLRHAIAAWHQRTHGAPGTMGGIDRDTYRQAGSGHRNMCDRAQNRCAERRQASRMAFADEPLRANARRCHRTH